MKLQYRVTNMIYNVDRR